MSETKLKYEGMELVLKYEGMDIVGLPVYSSGGRYYVDVEPRKRYEPKICTKLYNNFDGEPDYPIRADKVVIFLPERVTWD